MNKKISELNETDTLFNGCCFPLVQNSETKKITFETMKPFMKGDKGDEGDKGEKGDKGTDGISCTHYWNGTTLVVRSASGISSKDLKGEKGEKGDTGPRGRDGDNVALIYVAQFNAEAYAEARDNNLELLVTENFDDVSGLDLEDEETAQIVSECYDSENMVLAYNSQITATLKAKEVELDDEPKYFWIRVDWEGSGTLRIDIDFVGKKIYTDWKNCECKHLVAGQRGKTIGADLILTGEVTLKNIAWGVK